MLEESLCWFGGNHSAGWKGKPDPAIDAKKASKRIVPVWVTPRV